MCREYTVVAWLMGSYYDAGKIVLRLLLRKVSLRTVRCSLSSNVSAQVNNKQAVDNLKFVNC